MNYDHLNKIHDFWRNDVMPNLQHTLSVSSFDDYLKRFSYIPSGNWIKTLDNVKLTRVPFVVDPVTFSKKYKDHCVTYNSPARPEDGFQRAIYQFSPTLHAEVAYWGWMENDQLQSYTSFFFCYFSAEELYKFLDELYELRRLGDTEEKSRRNGGFSAMLKGNLIP